MTEESVVVQSRLREICPLMEIAEADVIEVEKSCHIAFEIIGYKPKNFVESFQKAWESSDSVMLCDFVFDVWREDK